MLTVYGATRRAVDRARRGDGVTLLEVKTFRLKGHAEHDNAAYVPPELIAEWQAKDPLPRFERVLLEMGFAKKEDFDAIQQRVKQESTPRPTKRNVPRCLLAKMPARGCLREMGIGKKDEG